MSVWNMDNVSILVEARPFCVFNNAPMDQLKEEGFEIIDFRGSGVHNPDFLQAAESVKAVLCGNELQINEEFLEKASNLELVIKIGAGLDNVDIAAASRHNVLICNTPGKNMQAVADHVFALILSASRKIITCDKGLRENRWEHTQILCYEIWQKTLGLIGLGAVGQNVALRAKGFQMKVVAHDPCWPEEFAQEHGIEQVSIEKLLEVSDIVSLHSPLTADTKGLIDKQALNRMKPSAFLINTARGAIINEADLYEALKNGVISGAGLDVFENEPPTDSPLLELDNVTLSPHTASFTYDSINNMNMAAVEQFIEFYNGTQPKHAVNAEIFDSIKT